MAALAKGEVVLFPFPYTDLSHSKLRPCLVLSEEMDEDIILCQITSQRTRRDNYVVPLGKEHTRQGTLHIDSYIRCNMLFTAHKKQIHKKICETTPATYKKVVEKITEIITN